jgi:ribosomal peptide maturation radical SAM protein 1
VVDVALLNMPFAPADRASAQVAILTACLERAGISSEELHTNLDLYDALREHDAHHPYASTLPALIGEWLFSRQPPPSALEVAARGSDPESPLYRLAGFAESWDASYEDLLDFRETWIVPFMERLLEERDWSQHSIVAFTLTYPQINASFWLADELKKRHPHLKTVFGGALSQIHPESAAAYMRAFDYVDHFVVGEAEPVFAELCRLILDDEDVADAKLPGVLARRGGEVVEPEEVALCENFDDAPFPDYRAFKNKRASLPKATQALIHEDIPVEMARGCVWAVKKVCSFCGFYPDGGYRRKSNDTALEELRWQRETLGWRAFYSLDAYLPHGLVSGVFRRIPQELPDITFPFVELRTRMKRSELELLRDAGVTLVQPGIECLEEKLLEKILKGVSLADNLLFLKWSKELGLECSWNLILGLPDATAEDLERQLMVIERIAHLAPPMPTRLLFVRGSTYHQRPDHYGLTKMRPDPFYSYVHPPHLDLEAVAYELVADWDMEPTLDVHSRTSAAVRRWNDRWSRGAPTFSWEQTEAGVRLLDGRDDEGEPRESLLVGIEAKVMVAMADAALDVDTLAFRAEASVDQVRAAVERFEAERWIVETEGRFLALAHAARPRSLKDRIQSTKQRWRSGGGQLPVLGQSS